MGFLSGLGKVLKFAAPIAAMAIPGMQPLAAAALAGGGSMLGNKMAGGTWKGSLINGLMSGATAGLMPGAGATGAASQGVGGTLKRVGGSLLTNLMNPDTMASMSRGVGAVGQTQAHNRGVELDAMMEADQMRILNDRDRRDDESHMMKGIRAANYIQSGGMQRQPRIGHGGNVIPSFRSPLPISADEKAAATTLEGQLMKRLQTPPQLRDYDSKMKPGTMENISTYAAPAMGVLESILRNRQQRPTMDPLTLQTQQEQPGSVDIDAYDPNNTSYDFGNRNQFGR